MRLPCDDGGAAERVRICKDPAIQAGARARALASCGLPSTAQNEPVTQTFAKQHSPSLRNAHVP